MKIQTVHTTQHYRQIKDWANEPDQTLRVTLGAPIKWQPSHIKIWIWSKQYVLKEYVDTSSYNTEPELKPGTRKKKNGKY